jgi:hypothetical protein
MSNAFKFLIDDFLNWATLTNFIESLKKQIAKI